MYQITTNIFLGHSQDAKNTEELDRNGITVCLNCARDLKYKCDRQYNKVGLMDGANNAPIVLEAAVRVLDLYIKAGHKVLVHCHSGISRSVTVIATWLAQTENITVYQALHFIATKKPLIYPHAGLILLARHIVEGIDIQELLKKR